MSETYRTIHKQELTGIHLFIEKCVDFLLESDKQFSTQVSSVDHYSLATSQQHGNRGKITYSPAEIKLSAHITALYLHTAFRFLLFFLVCIPTLSVFPPVLTPPPPSSFSHPPP